MNIRETYDSDFNDVLFVERAAFGQNDEAELVSKLLKDISAKPVLSLLAFKGDRPVGHILFTRVNLTNSENTTSAILAPLAVVPDAQRQGIGGKLIEGGLELLSRSGVELVFVLGDPKYYTRHGFQPAGCLGFEATYPIPEEHTDAWMVRELSPGVIGSASGKVICADTLNKPEYWLE